MTLLQFVSETCLGVYRQWLYSVIPLGKYQSKTAARRLQIPWQIAHEVLPIYIFFLLRF